MASVQVTIAGHGYRMACGEGDEARLTELAQSFDRRIAELRGAFGEIDDLRLHVMAALSIADELSEANRRIDGLEADAHALRQAVRESSARSEADEKAMAEALARTAERIERIAAGLAGSASGASH